MRVATVIVFSVVGLVLVGTAYYMSKTKDEIDEFTSPKQNTAVKVERYDKIIECLQTDDQPCVDRETEALDDNIFRSTEIGQELARRGTKLLGEARKEFDAKKRKSLLELSRKILELALKYDEDMIPRHAYESVSRELGVPVDSEDGESDGSGSNVFQPDPDVQPVR